jgi:molybdopterin converting factor small subunit
MKLNVHFEPPFNELTKELHKTVDFEKDITLEELLEHFYKKYGEKFKELIWDKNKKGVFSSFLSIIINGHSHRHDRFLQTNLKNGDDVTFLYLYFGG